MILRLSTIALFLSAAPALAGPANVAAELDRLNQALQGQRSENGCFVDPESSGKTCNETSDEFCKNLWDDNTGNMKVFDGEVRAGFSAKSGLSLAQLDDYKALAGSLPRLPADLRKRAEPVLRDLQRALAKEEDTKEWKRRIASLHRKFQHAVEDTAEDRQAKKYPKITAKDEADRSAEENAKLRTISNDLGDQVLKAKYAQSPNWKRVEKLFPQAKEDLVKVIDTLDISNERKAWMKERVRTVKLSLPVSALSATEDGTPACQTTEENAFYTPELHTFTVCAGLMNSYATDAGLYQTIAHEISHSIDSSADALRSFRASRPLAKALDRLVDAKGAGIPCGEWRDIEADALAERRPTDTPSDLDAFYACLDPRDTLKPASATAIEQVAEDTAHKSMGQLAGKHEFLKLGQPTFTVNGETEKNELYLRPDRLLLERNKAPEAKGPPPRSGREADPAEIFTQVLSCQQDGATDYAHVTDPAVRRRLFENALTETEAVLKRKNELFYAHCARTCSDMVGEKLARDPSENFADWMANRASRFLYARIERPSDRREAAALGNALLCDQAGPKRDAPGLAIAEKKFSTEEHPDDRTRRISEYDPFVSNQLGCTLRPNQGFATCEP